jgi:hypothetical protein
VITIIEHLIGKGRAVSIHDPHIQLDEIYGSNLSFVVSALPHIGRLLTRSLDELICVLRRVGNRTKAYGRGTGSDDRQRDDHSRSHQAPAQSFIREANTCLARITRCFHAK